MILRNRIRPSIKSPSKNSRSGRTTRKNSNIIRIGRANTRITAAALTTKTKTLRNQRQIIHSSGTAPSNRHRHIRTRRRRRRRLQMKKPATESTVLPQRRHCSVGIIPLDHTQRNRRLRPNTNRRNRQHRPHQPRRQRKHPQPTHQPTSISRIPSSQTEPANRPEYKQGYPPPPELSNQTRRPPANAPTAYVTRESSAALHPQEAPRTQSRSPTAHRLSSRAKRRFSTSAPRTQPRNRWIRFSSVQSTFHHGAASTSEVSHSSAGPV